MRTPGGYRDNNGKFKMFVMTTVQDDYWSSLFDLIANSWIEIYPIDFTGFQNLLLLSTQKGSHMGLSQSFPWPQSFFVPAIFCGLVSPWH